MTREASLLEGIGFYSLIPILIPILIPFKLLFLLHFMLFLFKRYQGIKNITPPLRVFIFYVCFF